MASWFAAGGVSGFAVWANQPVEALPELTREVYSLPFAGSIDTQGITRLQYPTPGSYYRRGVQMTARIRFTSADFGPLLNRAASRTVTMFVVDAAEFPGVKPDPSQMLALPEDKIKWYQGDITNSNLNGNPTNNSPGDYTLRVPRNDPNTGLPFPGLPEFVPQPNRKYWVLVAPTGRSVPGDTAASIPILGDINFVGRCISVWGNRTPVAPVIVSPSADSVYVAGDIFNFAFEGRDPDRLDSGQSSQHQDLAGVQIQYAPRPTPDNPTPEWQDMSIATNPATGSAGGGWWINRTTAANPIQQNNNGAYYFYAFQALGIKVGSNTMEAGRGILPAGNWQIRMRTFDYGHPFPAHVAPLGETDRNLLTPDRFPETNRSPWSEPIRVTVSAKVPPPIPITPVNNIAVPFGTPITLRWQYRNTGVPTDPQLRREVRIRKVGDPVWTLVDDNYSASDSYLVEANPNNPRPAPMEYLAGSDFENGFDNWSSTGGSGTNPPTSTQSLEIQSGVGVNNSKALVTVAPGVVIIPQRSLNPRAADKIFNLSGWTYIGANSQRHTILAQWYDAQGNGITTPDGSMSMVRAPGSGWVKFDFPLIIRPTNGARLTVALFPLAADNASSTRGDRIDQWSVVGSSGGNEGFVFQKSTQYEWQVRTTDTTNSLSTWSQIARFWIVPQPSSGPLRPVPAATINGATLGNGKHRALVFRRGGTRFVGEISNLVSVDWGRMRDDISGARIVTQKWDRSTADLLRKLQTWAYELVIIRDNGFSKDRVWEGPITLLTYEQDQVTIEAKDVLVYTYRRIIRQALNDSRNGDFVTSRAARIIQNAMAPDDPNVLQYLRVISDPSDAKQYRNTPGFARMAWEEVDDMAKNSGLDYTALGRAILLWGTKHRIGTLPEFRDEYFGSAPIVSEYGMRAANFYSVGDGTGVHGDANRLDVSGNDPVYGLIEMLSSSWASDSPADAGTYSQAGLATVIKSFEGYSERSIAERYPPPMVVRVPDNTTLSPNTPISIQNLVPGVAIPLRSYSTLRRVAGTQKLDSIKVNEVDGKEKIAVVMSPFTREDTGEEEAS